MTVSLILFWLVRRLMRHKPVAYGRPAYGAQAAAEAICSTKLLVRLMVRPGFTARTACAGLCGNFFGGNFIQRNTVYIYIYNTIILYLRRRHRPGPLAPTAEVSVLSALYVALRIQYGVVD